MSFQLQIGRWPEVIVASGEVAVQERWSMDSWIAGRRGWLIGDGVDVDRRLTMDDAGAAMVALGERRPMIVGEVSRQAGC